MLFEFSAGNWIGIHLGMSGKLRTEPAGFRPEKHDHFVLQQSAAGSGSLAMRGSLDECDFIMASPSRTGGAREDLIFLPINSIATFLDAFLDRHARAPIKAVLLLQSGFIGIGNWMADEILWRAKIAPAISAGALIRSATGAIVPGDAVCRERIAPHHRPRFLRSAAQIG